MKDKISVIIPAYNHEKFVGLAIESVLEQSYKNIEVIIIDDGSTDNTAKVIKGYSDDRLKYYYQENQDAYNALNKGIQMACGEYISILNSDDVYAKNRLEALVIHQKKSGAECLFTDVIPISDKGEVFADPGFGWNIWHRKNVSVYENNMDLYTAFLHGNFMVTTSNLFMTAKATRIVGSFRPLRYLHDYDFMFRMLLAFPNGVKYLKNEKLLYYRIHPGNTLSEAAIVGREQDQQVIREYLLRRLPEEYRLIVATGVDRLVELEKELNDVRRSLENHTMYSIKQSLRLLLAAIHRKIKM